MLQIMTHITTITAAIILIDLANLLPPGLFLILASTPVEKKIPVINAPTARPKHVYSIHSSKGFICSNFSPTNTNAVKSELLLHSLPFLKLFLLNLRSFPHFSFLR